MTPTVLTGFLAAKGQNMPYNYEWDTLKAKLNLSKHGVDFKEARKVFDDPMAITLFDDEESTPSEERWVTIGQSQVIIIWWWCIHFATPPKTP